MFLEIVPFARNIGRNFHPVGEPDAGNLADSGVWLTRRLGGHLGADPAFEGRGVIGRTILERIKTAGKRRHCRLRRSTLAPFPGKLVDGGHL